MNKRASLPGASELFRLTGGPAFDVTDAPASAKTKSKSHGHSVGHSVGFKENGHKEQFDRDEAASRSGSGRQKHDAKITVYVSGDELLAIEHARLALRGSHDLVVDRGRLVREAVATLLADFDSRGADSILVQRLRSTDANVQPQLSNAND